MSLGRGLKILIAIAVIVVGIVVGVLDDSFDNTPADAVSIECINENLPNDVRDFINSGYKGKYKLVPTSSDNSDIHFYVGESQNREGFTSTPIAKSRMVIAFPHDMVYRDREGNFHKFDNGSHGYFVTDAYKVFNNFLQAKSGTIKTEEYGFDTGVKEFILAIPDNGYLHKRDIIDSYIYIMANGEEITSNNATTIFNKVKELLSYATVLSDYNQLLETYGNYVGIVPEFMYSEIKGSNTWYPIYYNDCNYTELTMYTSDNLDSAIKNELTDYFWNSNKIYIDTGFYGKAAQSRSQGMCYTATNIQLVEKQNNFEELFGSNYWKQF